jgi:proteasome accessory factor A
MKRVFGIETEYGITLDGADEIDVVKESIEIVRCYTEHGALMKWDYSLEDPHQDARGFRAAELLQDTDEASYFEIDKARSLSFEEIKSDLVLSNGARFYNDHAHPEYSTPECSSLREIVSQDIAGERILGECARRRTSHLPAGQEARIYKNNTDFVGHSYGCHDNYLMDRDVPWDRIVRDVVPFLVTRQIFAGAGKLGLEGEDTAGHPGIYQIAQRSDFFSVLCSIDTMNRRPIVNTRDEPHADSRLYRRFHVITGDANMSQWATALKIGSTALVLELIELGHAPQLELADPIAATKQISRDQTHAWIIELKDGRKISALDIQRLYLAAAREHCPPDPDTTWVFNAWEAVLDDLASDYWLCRDRLDWVAKKFLLETLREAERLSWSDPWLQSIDLEYHNVSLERGLHYELVREDRMRRMVSEEEIKHAIFHPPETTRAFFRGRAVARFNRDIASIQWDGITFACNGTVFPVELNHPAHRPELDRVNLAIRKAASLEDLIERLRPGPAGED